MLFQEKKKSIKKNLLYALRELFRHPLKIILSTMVLFGAMYYRIAGMISFFQLHHGATFCLADAFVIVDSGSFGAISMKCVAILPIFLLLIMVATKSDYTIQHILRKKNRAEIFILQCMKVFWLSLLFALLITVSVLIAGYVQTTESINWHLENSVFWVNTGEVLENPISSANIVMAFFITEFLTLLFAGSLFVLFRWLFSNMLVSWIASMGLCFAECYLDGYFRFFYGNVNIDFGLWQAGYPMIPILLYAFAAIVILFGIWWLFGRKKEFYAK
ncbi:hypothetical protein LJC56_09360 [Christensenellaceae bacterium OttesenSCG-928-K19]|nr:hypothetical protein [Christensenellaceae bacterium OttesenSCG-928-K19]